MTRAIHHPTARALLFAAAGLAIACRGREEKPAPDAGRAAAPLPTMPPRAPAADERLADLEASKISLLIVKDREVTAPVPATMELRDARFSLPDGAPGSARAVVDLNTFDSKIPLRNDRVKRFFFETQATSWDTAELVIAPIPDAIAAAVREGKPASSAPVEVSIKLHGRTARIATKIDVTRDTDGTLHVKSSAPIEMKISDFGLADNLRRLSALCMHDSIDDVVKVDVALAFPPR